MDEIMKAVMETLVTKITDQLAIRMEERFEAHRKEMAEAYAGRIAELERQVASVRIINDVDGMSREIRESILSYLEGEVIGPEVSKQVSSFLTDGDAIENVVENYLMYQPAGLRLLGDVVEDKVDDRIKNRLEDMIDDKLEEFVDSLRLTRE